MVEELDYLYFRSYAYLKSKIVIDKKRLSVRYFRSMNTFFNPLGETVTAIYPAVCTSLSLSLSLPSGTIIGMCK